MKIIRSGYILFLLLLSLNTSKNYAQNPGHIYFDKITTENIIVEKGLSQNSVFSIHQDHIGYMWFGTWDGLNMYDGYEFTIYKEGKNALSNPTVNAILEDNDGILWVGTEGGLNKFNRSSKTFEHYKYNMYNPSSISSDTILCIYEDKNGYLWIGTQNGLNKFDKQAEVFFTYKNDPKNPYSITSNIIYDIEEDLEGTLWIATAKGLTTYDPKTKEFLCYCKDDRTENSILSNYIWSITIDMDGIIWIGSNKGLSSYDKKTGKFSHYLPNPNDPQSLSHNEVYDIIEDRFGALWIATYGGGLNFFDRHLKKFVQYNSSTSNSNNHCNDYIHSLFEDESGIIWVGTYGKGLSYVNRNSNKFTHYHTDSENKTLQISNNIVWSFMEDEQEQLWVGTDFGIDIIDRKNNTRKTLHHIPGDKNSLPSDMIRSLFRDKDGIYWIGTFNKGACNYDPKTKKITVFPAIKNCSNCLTSELVWCIYEDHSGYLWFGTNYGLSRFNKDKQEFKTFLYDKNNPSSISSNEIYDIYEDNFNNLWISTNDGLNQYKYKTESFKRFKKNETDSNSLSNSRIFTIYQDKENIYWIGTVGGGLNRYDPIKNTYKHYGEKHGLTNNVIYQILEDRKGFFWISTNEGIFKFDREKEIFVNYSVDDGAQSNEFNLGAGLKSKSGEFFFGGMNGFNSFFPEEVNQNLNIPPIVVTNFLLFNKVYIHHLKFNDTIQLEHNENFFSFEFSALDFTNPSKNKYAYMLEGIDKKFIYCSANRRFAEYTKVEPGTYTFKVIGSNNAGKWNEIGTKITVIIKPPWWKTLYFQIPFGLLIGFLIWYIIYIEIKRIKKKHHVEKSLLELERKALRLQMNPHFIFNTLNSIQFFILKNDKLASNKYLTMFSKLMRKTLDNSRQNTIPVREELESLRLYMELEQLRFDNKFKYEINIHEHDEDDILECKIPTMIIQPYIENAIIHGLVQKDEHGGILKIDLSSEKDFINCIIEDNGIGRDKALEIKNKSKHAHKSMGDEITKSRLVLLNALKGKQMELNIIDLKNENGEPIGTRVEVKIPILD